MKTLLLWKDGELGGNQQTANSEFCIILWYDGM